MQKTSNYNLNQWEPTDPIRREDFNADNAAIDAALNGLSSAMGQIAVPKIAAGTFTGNGAASRNINVGFTPKVVIVWGDFSQPLRSTTPTYSAMAVYGTPFTNALTVTENGFIAKCVSTEYDGAYYPNLNLNGFTYLYFAIG